LLADLERRMPEKTRLYFNEDQLVKVIKNTNEKSPKKRLKTVKSSIIVQIKLKIFNADF
jgi:hypothetical protein